jgi:hypothetical protein
MWLTVSWATALDESHPGSAVKSRSEAISTAFERWDWERFGLWSFLIGLEAKGVEHPLQFAVTYFILDVLYKLERATPVRK